MGYALLWLNGILLLPASDFFSKIVTSWKRIVVNLSKSSDVSGSAICVFDLIFLKQKNRENGDGLKWARERGECDGKEADCCEMKR